MNSTADWFPKCTRVTRKLYKGKNWMHSRIIDNLTRGLLFSLGIRLFLHQLFICINWNSICCRLRVLVFLRRSSCDVTTRFGRTRITRKQDGGFSLDHSAAGRSGMVQYGSLKISPNEELCVHKLPKATHKFKTYSLADK